MLGNIGEDGCQGADTKGVMIRHRDVVLLGMLARQSDVTAGLSGDPITEMPQGRNQFGTSEVARQARHAAMTSSRVK